MNCPKCTKDMEKVNYEGIEIERCTYCKGIWIENGDLEELLKIKGSENLDTGKIERGKDMNRIDNIECPVCGSQMVRMVDKDQPHIWYEKCVNHGIFLDAGELKDLKKNDMFDIVKSIKTMMSGGR